MAHKSKRISGSRIGKAPDVISGQFGETVQQNNVAHLRLAHLPPAPFRSLLRFGGDRHLARAPALVTTHQERWKPIKRGSETVNAGQSSCETQLPCFDLVQQEPLIYLHTCTLRRTKYESTYLMRFFFLRFTSLHFSRRLGALGVSMHHARTRSFPPRRLVGTPILKADEEVLC